jgi:hypothetical protein
MISAGETYTYTNTGNTAYEILGSNSAFDYVLYYSTGKVKETKSNTSGNIEVPAGGSLKITQVGISGQELDGLHEAFNVTNNSTSMQTYKAINTDTVDAALSLKSGYSCDYAVFDANNTLSDYNVSTTSTITIPKGGYAIVTVNTNSDAPFEDNSSLNITEYATPTYKKTYLESDETYKYTNTGSRELKVFKNGLSCDYVIHNADGSISEYGANATNDSFTVPIGGNICITSHNYINLKGLYDYFNVEKLDNSVFDIVCCALGETYQLTNNAAKDISLYTSGGIYDYVIYSADNSVKTEKLNSAESPITVPSGCKLAITPQVSNVSVYALKEAFTGISKRSYPVYKRVNAYYGTSVVMNNISDENITIYSVAGNYIDWATYDADNNVQTAKEFESPSSIEVPANGKVEITSRSSNVTFAGLYEYFSDEDLTVHATGIKLSSDSLTLTKGKQTMLTATVTPDDVTNKNVTWSSSDTSVAVVAQTGKVTAKAAGTAIITATTSDGGYTASCTVTVTDSSGTVTTPSPSPSASPSASPSTSPTPTVEPTNYPYEITSVSLETESGSKLTAVPVNSAFIVNVEFSKNQTRNDKDHLFVAVYDTNGALLSLDYARANFTEQNSYEIGFHVPAQSKAIGSVKAFVWNTFNSAEPLAQAKTITNY